MATKSVQSFFLAYAGKPELRAEAMREAAEACAARGVAARTWEDLLVEGRLIIDPILERIDESAACVAEISSSGNQMLAGEPDDLVGDHRYEPPPRRIVLEIRDDVVGQVVRQHVSDRLGVELNGTVARW